MFAAATLLPLIITLAQLYDERAREEQRASDGAVQTARLAPGQIEDLLDNARAIAHVVEDTARWLAALARKVELPIGVHGASRRNLAFGRRYGVS